MVAIIAMTIVFLAAFGMIAFFLYRRTLRKAKNIERGLKMVPLLIHLPPPSEDTSASMQGGGSMRDVREIAKESVSHAEVLYDLIAGTAAEGFKSKFYGQRHLALEIIASKGLVYYYAAVPVALVDTVKNAIVTAYPGARIEQAEDHNLFSPAGKLSGTVGGELVLKAEPAYPLAGIEQLGRDPLTAVLNLLSSLGEADGVGIQILVRPSGRAWSKRSIELVKRKHLQGMADTSLRITGKDVINATLRTPEHVQKMQERSETTLTDLQKTVLDAIEKKTQKPGFEVLIRVLVSSNLNERSQQLLKDVLATFAQFDAPGMNGFKFLPASDMAGLVTAFILRFFPPEVNQTVLSSSELSSLFHLPDAQFSPTNDVVRDYSKQVDGPPTVPSTGLLLGYNLFRGTKKEIHLSPDDRRRHTYIVGQTGTGKSTLLENLAVQDMLAGNGFAFIDPHGDTTERLLGMVPKNRAEDIIYFNPGDMENPLGLNLFEFTAPEQKDFLIQEAIGMLYKLYDPGHTGIIGPRYEHWFRNAALTLMSDPAGATFIEIPKVFTDTEYLKQKFKYIQDPTVIDFWTKEMAQTSDYHKSEMLGWFVSKFGAFQSNEMMRNIIGQPKSAFNLRDIMDNKKILLVNLSKGRVGELNSQLLGMVFVIKFQAAAMSRASVPEEQRTDFSLYVDEFQNFSTDSFASILSEARKYRLNLIVANQFIGQLTDQIRDAVFGNVGTVISYRCGPDDAEFLTKQFAPAFEGRDLVNIPNFNAVIRLMIAGLPSQPFSLTALPPLGVNNTELAAAVKQLSAAKFGKPRSAVEQALFGRLGSGATPSTPAPAPVVQPTPAAAQPALPPASAAVTNPAPAPTPPTQPAPLPPARAASSPASAPVAPIQASPKPASVPAVTPTKPVGPPPVPLTKLPLTSAPAKPAVFVPAGKPSNGIPNLSVTVESKPPVIETAIKPAEQPLPVLGKAPIVPEVKASPQPPKPVPQPSPPTTSVQTKPVPPSPLSITASPNHVPVDPLHQLADYAKDVPLDEADDLPLNIPKPPPNPVQAIPAPPPPPAPSPAPAKPIAPAPAKVPLQPMELKPMPTLPAAPPAPAKPPASPATPPPPPSKSQVASSGSIKEANDAVQPQSPRPSSVILPTQRPTVAAQPAAAVQAAGAPQSVAAVSVSSSNKQPAAVGAGDLMSKPLIAPGEIYVDDNGNVIQG